MRTRGTGSARRRPDWPRSTRRRRWLDQSHFNPSNAPLNKPHLPLKKFTTKKPHSSNTNGFAVTQTTDVRDPKVYKTCRAPSALTGSGGIVNEQYAISMLYSEATKKGNWR